jgi:hypothetical protein
VPAVLEADRRATIACARSKTALLDICRGGGPADRRRDTRAKAACSAMEDALMAFCTETRRLLFIDEA